MCEVAQNIMTFASPSRGSLPLLNDFFPRWDYTNQTFHPGNLIKNTFLLLYHRGCFNVVFGKKSFSTNLVIFKV